RHAVRADIVPYLTLGPVREWVDLHKAAMLFVNFNLVNRGARGGLVATQTRDPSVERAENAFERQDFPGLTAQQAKLGVAVKQVNAMTAYDAFDLRCVREVHFDRDAVLLAHLIKQGVGFLGQPPGVNGEDAHGGINTPRHIEDRHAVGLKTRTDRRSRAETFERPA